MQVSKRIMEGSTLTRIFEASSIDTCHNPRQSQMPHKPIFLMHDNEGKL